MLEKLLAAILQRTIGQFVEGLDGKSLKLGIWSGKVVLRDFKLRPDALYTLGLPLSIKAGQVKELTLDIPWRRIGKEAVVVRLSGVTLVAGPLDEDEQFTDDRLRQWVWRRKQLELQSLVQRSELGEAAQAVLQPTDKRVKARKPRSTTQKKSKGGSVFARGDWPGS